MRSALREENVKLKRLVADLSLDKAMLQDVLTCWSIFGPVDTLGQWPFGYRGSHEEDKVFRRADGQDPARGGQHAGSGGGQEAWGQRCHDLRLAQALRAARASRCEAAAAT